MDTGSFLVRCFLAGVVGAWAASFLIHLHFAVRHPEALNDGQYVMVFLFTVPMGWLFGSIVGTVLAYFTLPHPIRQSGRSSR